MINDIIGFLKFQSQEQYLDKLLDGNVYCNSKKFFSELPEEYLIGDKYEKIVYIDYGDSLTIPLNKIQPTYCTMYRNSEGKYLSLVEQDDEYVNFFCLYAIRIKDCEIIGRTALFNIPEAIKTKADNFVLIAHPSIFVERIKECIADKFYFSVVKYLNISAFRGLKSYFIKPQKYSVQNEARFVIYNTEDAPLNFSIGCIRDIATKVPMGAKTIKIILPESVLSHIQQYKSYQWEVEKLK